MGVPMSIRLNEIVPDFTAETDQGEIGFHEWIGDGWAIMFSHPKDFTGVCTTGFSAVAQKRACNYNQGVLGWFRGQRIRTLTQACERRAL